MEKNRMTAPPWTSTDNTLAMYAEELLEQAAKAAENAYAPYSRFKVGAALLLADGTISRGCNVENASYGATVCAERVAVLAAVADGRLTADRPPVALAVTALPCALCLQVLGEFAGEDMPIFIPDGEDFVTYRLRELLPHRFER